MRGSRNTPFPRCFVEKREEPVRRPAGDSIVQQDTSAANILVFARGERGALRRVEGQELLERLLLELLVMWAAVGFEMCPRAGEAVSVIGFATAAEPLQERWHAARHALHNEKRTPPGPEDVFTRPDSAE